MNPRERGVALLLVVVALATLLPLALVLSSYVLTRHRQVNLFRENVGGQAVVRGALALSMARLRSGKIAPRPGEAETLAVDEPPSRPVHVTVSRQPDAVLTLDGSVLGPDQVLGLDLQQLGFDGEGRTVHQFRRLEVYLVEAESPDRFPFPAVRLLAVVARLENGQVVCLGLRYDRGY